jgi:hypothetical protein
VRGAREAISRIIPAVQAPGLLGEIALHALTSADIFRRSCGGALRFKAKSPGLRRGQIIAAVTDQNL